MFCPVGYRSVAELWKEFSKVRLETIYTSTVAGYNKPNFKASFTRGSPLDICEHVFLKSLCEVGLHLASPAGDVVRTNIQLEEGRASILSTEGPYSSMWREAHMRLEKTDNTDTASRLFHLFKSWCYEPTQGDKWSETYQAVTSFEGEWQDARVKLIHHTLPIHFTRESYLVSDEMAPWSTKLRMAPAVAPILENFSGWALCLDEGTYQDPWQEYLYGRVALYPTQEQMEHIGGQLAGRPRMEEARAVFEAMGGDKGALTWSEVASRIESQTGVKPSHKSLRNWRDEFNESK